MFIYSRFIKLSVIITFILLSSCQKNNKPLPYGAIPTESQIRWQEMERYAFVHFSLNTFTGAEWGYGDISTSVFNPEKVDCNQWVEVFKKAGMKGVIITAKHHDGFCLWPSKYTEYSVKNSPWKNGKGDLIKDLSEACKLQGLKFGIYLSPWDRNHKDYGKPEYISYFRNQLEELLTNYGDIFEIWFDGANGGNGYYGGANETRNVDRKTYYDWENTYKLVRKLQPQAILFSDAGPGCRWCGTEQGWVGATNWSTLNKDKVWPGYDKYKELRYGHENGTHWIPAEVDVSIRPGWFYHASEDHKVKSLAQLVDIYYNSVGRNATMLLNFPINKEGLIPQQDIDRLHEFNNIITEDFTRSITISRIKVSNVRNDKMFSAENMIDGSQKTYWTTENDVNKASVTLYFDQKVTFNRLLLQEYIKLGQRVEKFTVSVLEGGYWRQIESQTTIGYKRILRFPSVEAKALRVDIVAKASPVISNIQLFNAPKLLLPPVIKRTQQDIVEISNVDNELKVFYTIDGSMPTIQSSLYNSSFLVGKKATIKAVCFDETTKQFSSVTTRRFDVSKKYWKLLSPFVEDETILIFDDDKETKWQQKLSDTKELIIDLGQKQLITGFTYLPDQGRWASGIISDYEFYISNDNKSWVMVDKGEFSNIKNNPILQIKRFQQKFARYIKLKAVKTLDNRYIGCSEFDIITN